VAGGTAGTNGGDTENLDIVDLGSHVGESESGGRGGNGRADEESSGEETHFGDCLFVLYV